MLLDPLSADVWTALRAVAPRFGLRLTSVELRDRPYDYERAIAGVPSDKRKILIALGSPFYFADRVPLAEVALRHHMLMLADLRESVAAGSLISYGPSLIRMFALAADYVGHIAQGAKPRDLPIQQPTKFELVVNLKTAKALALTLPTTLLARADDVFE